ncbi:hypothetical protein H0H81_004604, partial [Sphagnurus paluster]
ETLHKSQIHLNELRLELQAKRYTALMFRVLHAREQVRVTRLQALVRYMDDERFMVVSDFGTIDEDVIKTQYSQAGSFKLPYQPFSEHLAAHSASTSPPTAKVPLSYPRGTFLARMRAHNIVRLPDSVSQVPRTDYAELEVKAVQIVNIFSVAWDYLAHSTQRKNRADLQYLVDQAVALGFLCEHLIASISVFLEETASVLRACVVEETSQVKGYVDMLRLRVAAKTCVDEQRKTDFLDDIGKTAGIWHKDAERVLRAVEDLLQRDHQSAALEKCIVSLAAPSQSAHDETLISAFESTNERAQQLLTRKVDKAALAETLVGDINGLLGDIKTLVGLRDIKSMR